MNWLFYVLDCPSQVNARTIGCDFKVEIWKPASWRVRPREFALWPFCIWWAFDQLRVFSNRDYCLVLVRKGTEVVHRSCIFPRYFRFPFMAPEDLQVGDTWTAPAYRGLGLGTYGLQSAAKVAAMRPRRLWYIVEENNAASIRVAEKVGFVGVARGKRTSRLGVHLLGSFILEQTLTPKTATSTPDRESAVAS